MKSINRLSLIILVCIIVLGFLFRLYRIDNSIADWHSWRQADTSAVSRNFVKNGFDLLHPRMDNISNVQSGMDNPEGYFFVEFPIYNATQAGLFTLFDFFTLEEWGRLVSITASLIATIFLSLIVSKHSNQKIGLLAAFFYAFFPYNIYYGRTILPESSMVMAVLGGIYFFDLWIDTKALLQNRHSGKRGMISSRIDSGHLPANARLLHVGARMTYKKYLFFILAILFTLLALLLKPFAIFFVLPMLYLAWKQFGLKLFLTWQLWFFAILTVTPLALWRTWIAQFPEGIPSNLWLLNGNGIRFRPSFFRWILYERLTILISGYFGMVFGIVGLFTVWKLKDWPFFLMFIVSSIVYVSVVATGNVQHDYYQILIMPSVAIVFAIGAYFLSLQVIRLNVIKFVFPIGAIVVLICLIGGFYYSWDKVKDYFNIDNESIIVAGKAVQRLTSPDAKVIANYNGDSSFLYQTNRKGWASFQDPLPVMVQKGADYLVLVNPTEDDMVFAKDYKVVEKTKEYVIFDLKINQ